MSVYDYVNHKITIIEVGITNRWSLSKVEVTKMRRYDLLAGELRAQHQNYTVALVPVVVAWDSATTKHSLKHLEKIGLYRRDLAQIQVIALKQSTNMVRLDSLEN